MKAATLPHRCTTRPSAPSATSGTRIPAHAFKRRPVPATIGASPDRPDAASYTVTFDDLPAAADEQLARRDAGGTPRVLLIDSDGDTAIALHSLLMPEARIVHASTGAEARRLLETQLFSLVIIDPNLPDGDGCVIVNAVSNTPILIYSTREPARNDKFSYLPKPWTTPRILWSTISSMLGIAGSLAAGD